MGEENSNQLRYALKEIASSYSLAVVDTKENKAYTTEQALVEILNKLDSLQEFTKNDN